MLTKQQAKRVAHLIQSYGDLRRGFPQQGKGLVDTKSRKANPLWAESLADPSPVRPPASTLSLVPDEETGGYRIVRQFRT
jgi:hypothetical protein